MENLIKETPPAELPHFYKKKTNLEQNPDEIQILDDELSLIKDDDIVIGTPLDSSQHNYYQMNQGIELAKPRTHY